MRPFRFGVAVEGASSREQWIAQAQEAENLGYTLLLIPDHFVTHFSPLIALMAAIDATKTLRVGSLVCDNDFRHPALLAKEAATLDLLSGGRFELGLGAGWHKPEYESVGLPFEGPGVRIERLAEALHIIKQFLTDEYVNFAGLHYTITDLQAMPRPVQRPHPPIFMGGGGKKMLTLAAQEADIIGLHVKVNGDGSVDASERTEAALARKREWIRQAAGTRFADIEFSLLLSGVIITQDQQEAIAGFVRENQHEGVTPEQVEQNPYLLIGSVDQIAERLLRWREQLGISYIVAREDALQSFAPVIARLSGL